MNWQFTKTNRHYTRKVSSLTKLFVAMARNTTKINYYFAAK